MKKYLIVLLLLPFIGLAQTQNESFILKSFRLGTALQYRPYGRGVADTTQAIQPWKWASTWVQIVASDSASIYLKYQVATEDTGATASVKNWSTATTFDSVSVAGNGPEWGEVELPSAIKAAPLVRFIIGQNGAFRMTTTDSTYTARVVHKRY